MIEEAADIGIAFDGDGDRLVVVDATGKLLDGDHLLYVIAQNQTGRTPAAARSRHAAARSRSA